MSNWGDDESWGETSWEETPAPSAPAAPRSSSTSASVFGVDVGGLASEYVDAAVKAAVKKQVAEVAGAAVEEALTDDLVEALRAQAEDAAAAAITDQVEANDAAGTPEEESAGDDAPPLYYGSVDEFFREYLRLAYRRQINGRARVWAADWWNYDEAVIRLEALWRSWEELRQDASTGMSVWWRDHADHHMAVLMDPDGPFAAADAIDEANQSRKGDPLPYTAPPEGLFRDVRLPDEPVELNDAG